MFRSFDVQYPKNERGIPYARRNGLYARGGAAPTEPLSVLLLLLFLLLLLLLLLLEFPL